MMTNNQYKKFKAKQHNEDYEESKKPKAQYERSRVKARKAKQMLAIMMAAQGRTVEGGY